MLANSPEQAVTLFRQNLKPVPQADAKLTTEALRSLDSAAFAARERAMEELSQLGEAAEPALRQVLDAKPSAEDHRRLELLLAQLGDPDQLRRSRALEVLEQDSSSGTRRFVELLSSGDPEARLTKDSRAALRRMARRSTQTR